MEIKTKFNDGQKVWVMYENKPFEGEINKTFVVTNATHPDAKKINSTCTTGILIEYYISIPNKGNKEFTEPNVFESKEELILELSK